MNLPEFTGPPKALAIDLDGTLLNSDKAISERSRRALEKCVEHDIPVIIATARPARWMPRFFTESQMAVFSFINQNGGIGRGNGPLSGTFRETIPRKLVESIIRIVLSVEPDMRLTLELEGWEFGTNRPRDAVELWGVNAAFPGMQLTIAEALEREVTKVAAGELERDITHVAGILQERFGDHLSLVPGDGLTFLNITMGHATKPRAIERLISSRGLTLADVLAIGDDIPDLDMLKTCGTAVAMSNACREVLDACPYRTGSNDEDGVAMVLEKILSAKQ